MKNATKKVSLEKEILVRFVNISSINTAICQFLFKLMFLIVVYNAIEKFLERFDISLQLDVLITYSIPLLLLFTCRYFFDMICRNITMKKFLKFMEETTEESILRNLDICNLVLLNYQNKITFFEGGEEDVKVFLTALDIVEEVLDILTYTIFCLFEFEKLCTNNIYLLILLAILIFAVLFFISKYNRLLAPFLNS